CPGGEIGRRCGLKIRCRESGVPVRVRPGAPFRYDAVMTSETLEITTGSPLTMLSEEEQMFQQSVRDFAIEKIRPLVHQMDHDAVMSKVLISSFFDLGIMGIEIPDQWGGAG